MTPTKPSMILILYDRAVGIGPHLLLDTYKADVVAREFPGHKTRLYFVTSRKRDLVLKLLEERQIDFTRSEDGRRPILNIVEDFEKVVKLLKERFETDREKTD